MYFSKLQLLALFVALSEQTGEQQCNRDDCFRAIIATTRAPVAQAFCSSILMRSPGVVYPTFATSACGTADPSRYLSACSCYTAPTMATVTGTPSVTTPVTTPWTTPVTTPVTTPWTTPVTTPVWTPTTITTVITVTQTTTASGGAPVTNTITSTATITATITDTPTPLPPTTVTTVVTVVETTTAAGGNPVTNTITSTATITEHPQPPVTITTVVTVIQTTTADGGAPVTNTITSTATITETPAPITVTDGGAGGSTGAPVTIGTATLIPVTPTGTPPSSCSPEDKTLLTKYGFDCIIQDKLAYLTSKGKLIKNPDLLQIVLDWLKNNLGIALPAIPGLP